MNKKHLLFPCLFFAICLFCYVPIHAQKELTDYQTDLVYLKFHYYIKNGKTYPHLYGFLNLKNEMQVSPDAVIEYGKFEKKRNIAITSILAGVGLGLYGIINDQQDMGKRVAILSVGLGFEIVGIVFGVKAAKNAKQAVGLRNRMF